MSAGGRDGHRERRDSGGDRARSPESLRGGTLSMADDDRTTSMQFCQECNNLMYPREVYNADDPQDSRLVFVCKAPNCVMSSRRREECAEAESTLVWKHVVQHAMRTDDIINADITQDPTLPRTNGVTCSECQASEAVYLQAASGAQQGVSLFFVCCQCNHMWKEGGALAK